VEQPQPPGSDRPADHALHFAPITVAEKAGALLLVAATVLIGLNPDLLLNWINPALQSPLLQAALKAGTP
jgi:NADH-quinone oxidoreductase subunit M